MTIMNHHLIIAIATTAVLVITWPEKFGDLVNDEYDEHATQQDGKWQQKGKQPHYSFSTIAAIVMCLNA